MTFAEKLTKLRTKKGLTIKALAAALDLNEDLMAKWEKNQGEPSLTQLALLAKFFNVSSDYLLGMETKKEQPLPLAGLIAPFIDLEKEQEKEMDEELLEELVQLTRAVDLKRQK